MLVNNSRRRLCGMSLPELLVSTSIFSLVVVGSTASALLLAKIASDHENRADFSTDTRVGMEQITFDVRNADGVVNREDRSFVLSNTSDGNITYTFTPDTGKVTRKQGGTSIDIFSNVKNFDVLRNAADAPSGMTFKADEIAIEELEFENSNGTSNATNLLIKQFALKIRKT